MSEIRKRIIFHGTVQGVGFRYRAAYLAQNLGLSGWVKNEWNGTVVLEAEGRSQLIDELLRGINRGSYISIDWMDEEKIPVKGENGFYII